MSLPPTSTPPDAVQAILEKAQPPNNIPEACPPRDKMQQTTPRATLRPHGQNATDYDSIGRADRHGSVRAELREAGRGASVPGVRAYVPRLRGGAAGEKGHEVEDGEEVSEAAVCASVEVRTSA